MTKLLDRQLFFSYLQSYVICLVSMLSLFIIVDLFANLDNIAENHRGLGNMFAFIFVYYSAKVAMIFDRLSESIVLMAAMFTVAWMQRNNEILPLLSAGVSTRRIVRPVLVAASVMVGVAVLNQEFVLPTIDPLLIEQKDTSDKEIAVKGGMESNKISISGMTAKKSTLTIRNFAVVFPNGDGWEGIPNLQAQEAHYLPEDKSPDGRKCWQLVGTRPPTIANIPRPDILTNPVEGKYYLYVKEIDFEAATRPKNWEMYVPTWQLLEEMGKVEYSRRQGIAVLFHTRLTRPILGVLLVFMGLSVILRDQNRNLFVNVGQSLILCVGFFLASFVCRFLGDHGEFAPMVAAWLPVLVFGPLSFVMFDAVHT
jgi:lipopolysaccharide export system permease protein